MGCGGIEATDLDLHDVAQVADQVAFYKGSLRIQWFKRLRMSNPLWVVAYKLSITKIWTSSRMSRGFGALCRVMLNWLGFTRPFENPQDEFLFGLTRYFSPVACLPYVAIALRFSASARETSAV